MPERFDVNYIDKDGKQKRPVIIHRTVIGSVQRFMGVLIEHFAGAFPLWLAPEQVWIVPVSDKFVAYANKVQDQMRLKIPQLRVVLRDENPRRSSIASD